MISVIILCHNEERNLKDCISSVLWADELIVIDDHSDDASVQTAKSLGATVYFHDLQKDFAQQRNFGLEKARGDWILFLDADERVSESLKQEIQTTISQRRNRYVGYRLKRDDVVFGKVLKHGETANSSFIRLGKKGSGTWVGAVHETWRLHGHVGKLQTPLIHYPHSTVSDFLASVNLYTDIRARELYKKKVQSTWYLILLYPKAKFLKNYFLNLGILDGMPGLVSALMMSFHSFLVRSKLWLLWQNRP